MLREEVLTRGILGAAITVHSELGPGLLESAYKLCLEQELRGLGLHVESEVPIPIRYRGVSIEGAFRADLIVNRTVLIELKAVDRVLPIHESQILTYLRLSGLHVGLLINFSSPTLRQGIRRFVR